MTSTFCWGVLINGYGKFYTPRDLLIGNDGVAVVLVKLMILTLLIDFTLDFLMARTFNCNDTGILI